MSQRPIVVFTDDHEECEREAAALRQKLARIEALRLRWATETGDARDFDYGRWFRAAADELTRAVEEA